MPGYKVLIDDNYHYIKEDERVTHGTFATAADAIQACQEIVDGFLVHAFEPGMTAAALYEVYTGFGDDPFILPVDSNDAPVAFSAWKYARDRSAIMATGV